MKDITKVLLAGILLISTCYSCTRSHANGKTYVSELVDRHLSGFNSVSVSGPYDVFITQGAVESVRVEAPSKMIYRIITEVNDGVLSIYNQHNDWGMGYWFGNHHQKIIIYVTAKSLSNVDLSGSGDVNFKDGLTANSLKLSVVGSGDMTGKVTVKSLECNISGSGDMKISGNTENSTVQVVGSGDFSGRDLLTVNTAVHVSGSGDASINASNKVDASVAGSGDIYYSGATKNITSSKSGSGDISRN